MIEKIEKPVTPLELNSKINEIIDNIASKSIGEIISVACGSGYVPEGCLPCDGAEYTKAQFPDLWSNYLTSEEYENEVESYDDNVTIGSGCVDNNGIISNVNNNLTFAISSDDSSTVIYFKTGSDIITKQNLLTGSETTVDIEDGILNTTVSVTGEQKFSLCNLEPNTEYYLKYAPNPSATTSTPYTIELFKEGTRLQTVHYLFNFTEGAIVGNFLGSIDLTKSYYIDENGEKKYYAVTKQIPKTLLKTCTYEDYATDFETYGQCGKFAIDSENEKFRVPIIKDGAVIQQALSDSELGKSYNAGLPNIIANAASGSSSRSIFSGAIQYTKNVSGESGGSDGKDDGWNFDASRCSSIYGNSDTVQPNAVALRYFVVVANGEINQSQMDWSAWASGLQSKLNKDHSNDEKPYITEVSDKSLLPSWYRVWSDGWCEQGGRSSDNVESTTISFLLEFNDTNYTITTSDTRAATTNSHTGGASYGIYIGSYTTKSFYISLAKSNKRYAEWRACGYVKLSNV